MTYNGDPEPLSGLRKIVWTGVCIVLATIIVLFNLMLLEIIPWPFGWDWF